MKLFADRTGAGIHLAHLLQAYHHRTDAVVLALPRGGVTVAYEIAKGLQLPLDVFLVRKLGTPGNEELAMGAITENDVTVFNDDIIYQFALSKEKIDAIIVKEKDELLRRQARYRGGKAMLDIRDKRVILVDDGIATGATVKAALLGLKQFKPAHITLAVPLAATSSLITLQPFADEIICPHTPEPFWGVGMWYGQFPQVTDEEVCDLLEKTTTPN